MMEDFRAHNATVESDFRNYVERTIDPGWLFTVIVVVLSILLNICLPCFVTIGKRFDAKSSRQGGSSPPAVGTEEGIEFEEEEKVIGNNVAVSKYENNSELYTDNSDGMISRSSVPPDPSNRGRRNASTTTRSPADTYPVNNNDDEEGSIRSSRYPRSVASSTTGSIYTRGGERSAPRGDDDHLSVVSRSSFSTASYVIGLATSVLDARPTPRAGHFGHDKKIKNRAAARKASRPEIIDTRGRNMTRGEKYKHCRAYSPAPSALSRVDIDAVSFNDAVDFNDPGRKAAVLPIENYDGGKVTEIDLLYGKNAWWKPSVIARAHDNLLDIADWDQEMKSIMKLAIPYSIRALLEGIFSIVDVALIGHMVGTHAANAYVVVAILAELTNTINYGFVEAIGNLGPQAEGAENPLLVGRYLQLCTVLHAVGGLPVMCVWFFFMERAILWLGFDSETAQIGQQYAYSFVVIELVNGVDSCFHAFLDFTEHEKYSAMVQLLQGAGRTLPIFLMAIFDYRDLPLIGIVQLFVAVVLLVVNATIIIHMGWLNDYWEGLFGSLAFMDRRALSNVIRTSLPLSISWILTYGEWEIMTLFASSMGPAEVAAWGLLGFVWTIFEYMTDGLADAAEVRVAYHMGAGNPNQAKKSAYKSIVLGLLVSLFVTSILFFVGEDLTRLITPDPTLQRMIFELLPLVGVGQIVMTSGLVCWAVVGAQGRFRLSTSINFAAVWLVNIPLSAIFVYVLGWNLEGPVASMVLAYTISGTVNSYIVFRSDWRTLSDIVVRDNAAEESISVLSPNNESAMINSPSNGDMISPKKKYEFESPMSAISPLSTTTSPSQSTRMQPSFSPTAPPRSRLGELEECDNDSVPEW